MNNSELDSILKKARVPERPPDFWEGLPGRVAGRLDRAGGPERGAARPFLPRLSWGLAVAACALLAAFAAGHWRGRQGPRDILQSVKLIDETLALFPRRVRAIVQDEHGLRLVLSERGDVPSSPPLYIRICDGKRCSSLVTFSGQEIEVAGQDLVVLSDARGGIILAGGGMLWSSTEPLAAGNHLEIEARNLGPRPM